MLSAHVVERNELLARLHEALACDHFLALERAEEGLLHVEAEQLEYMGSDIFRNMIAPCSERRLLPELEHVIAEGSVSVGNEDGLLPLGASVVHLASFISGKVNQIHAVTFINVRFFILIVYDHTKVLVKNTN